MTMALMKRKSTATFGGSLSSRSSSGSRDTTKSSKSWTWTSSLLILVILIGIWYAVRYSPPERWSSVSLVEKVLDETPAGAGGGGGHSFDIDANVKLILDVVHEDDFLVPYKATLIAKKEHCPNLGFWLRLEGESLYTVVMQERGDFWEGSISPLPVGGSYSMVAYWKGCNNRISPAKKIKLMAIAAKGESATLADRPAKMSDLFPESAWISSKRFKNAPLSKPYIWHNPAVPTKDASLIVVSNSTVSKQGGVFVETGLYSFHQLSNYELVCFQGTKSAADSRNAFLELRRTIASGQRPFKFHLYHSNNFVHPAEEWPEFEQARFRKCKHILVSMDQIKTSLTQQEYANQLTTFINHLIKAFPDETFPIWVYTVNESPMEPTNCLPPYFLPRTSHHPCNDVLKYLFDKTKTTFPERVHLLDNTPISLPQLGEHPEDVQAAIALRVFVFVGKKVREWRDSGQVGREDGLHRGGIVEPNFDLVPYPDWI